MLKLATILFVTFLACSSALGQLPENLLNQIRQIKLLQSTRPDVKRILRQYESSDSDSHYQEFSNDAVSIEVTYSRGCQDSPEDDDPSEVWNVPEWTVTRIEISPDEPVTLKDSGMDLTKFRREPRYPETTDSWVYYDKVSGFAFKTTEDGIQEYIFFPPRAKSTRLCRNSTAAKGFYTRKGWFSQERPNDVPICVNYVANVTGLSVSTLELALADTTTISVATVAVDPENDVLTYIYNVSGGRIIGTGANVTWDLAGVSPGTYTITAGVDDGCGICGNTMTKTVVVK
jgi:hypothetical protein